jgi:NAD(P)H-hydrate epimerase
MKELDLSIIKKIFKLRLPNSHKGNHGHAVIIAGSESKIGAAIIATKACLRAGVGLVTLNISKKDRNTIFIAIPEAMVAFREDKTVWNQYNAFGIGPGIGTDELAENLLKNLILNVKLPIVFDADALNSLAINKEELLKIPQKSILTPHVKEFDRLFGSHHSEFERRETSISKAKELQLIIVLKGYKTFITDGEDSYENTTGNAGLAKGGSGDALTGIITAFLAQGYEPLKATLLGVYIHGLAADITLETQSVESMLITDVIENLGIAFKKIQL